MPTSTVAVQRGPAPGRARPDAVRGAGRAAAGRSAAGRGAAPQRRDRAAAPGAPARGSAGSRRPTTTPRKAAHDVAAAQVDQSRAALRQAETNLALHQDRFADRRRRRRPPVRRRPDGRGVVPGADAVHHRPGPDQDAGPGRRRPVGHRPDPVGQIARFTVDAYPDAGVRGHDHAGAAERHGEPERRSPTR